LKKKYFNQSVYTFVPALAVLLIAIIAGRTYGISLISFTRDVTTLGDLPFYAGLISTVGVFLWGVTAAICFFSALIFTKFREKELFRFFIMVAFISAYLMLDDLLLIHEHSGAWIRGGEKSIVLLLGAAVASHLYFFRKIILGTHYWMLLLALGMLGVSVVVDEVQPFLWEKGDFHTMMEDGTKWLGIACWSSYYIETAFSSIIRKTEEKH